MNQTDTPTKPSLEQRIAIIADYNADKIKEIRELIEEYATNFCQDVLNNIEINGVNLVEYKKVNTKELHNIYQQSK